MNISKTVSAVGLVLALAGIPGLAYAASPSPQMSKTGVGEGAGNAAGAIFGDGGLSTSTVVTGVVVVTAIGVAVAAATDDGDEVEDTTPEPPTTTTTTTATTTTN
jgi:hypothetical protein